MISFKLTSGGSNGPRTGVITTPHGDVETPCFMPVGSAATVKAMAPWDLEEAGAEIILGNTYHLLLRPGVDVVKKLGGLHSFMGWKRPILTDSGGYQIVSLTERVKITEEGVEFRSHLDGTPISLTPEDAVRSQRDLGSDIAMVLDEPVRLPADGKKVREAMERTIRWAGRSRDARDREAPRTALFGIMQGGADRGLRAESAERTAAIGFDGYAIGGLSVGEGAEELHNTAAFAAPLLPSDRPRYLMGVGTPSDILRAIGYGVDMFDCVLPTRNARNGWLYTRRGPMRIKHAIYRDDPRPPDEACKCRTCSLFSRAYIRHLYLAGEMLAGMLITRHNIYFYIGMVRQACAAIRENRYNEFAKALLDSMNEGADGGAGEESQ